MSDLKIDYAALDRAATAVRAARDAVERARGAFQGPAALAAGDFTSKGEEAARQYDQQREDMAKVLANTETSYDAFGMAFAAVATLFRHLDEKAAGEAGPHGPGARLQGGH